MTECDEAERFLSFLCDRVAGKRVGVDTNPTFKGDRIRASFVMVGRPGVRDSPEPYLEWVNDCIMNGINSIHLLGSGRKNAKLARNLLRRLEEEKKVRKVGEYSCFRTRYGERMKALRIICEVIPHVRGESASCEGYRAT